MGFLIYFIGSVVAYLITRKVRRSIKNTSREDKWFLLAISLALSITSWFGVIITLVLLFVDYMLTICEKTEPPKWL